MFNHFINVDGRKIKHLNKINAPSYTDASIYLQPVVLVVCQRITSIRHLRAFMTQLCYDNEDKPQSNIKENILQA